MIQVYGVDIGVRRAHFFGIGEGKTDLLKIDLDITKPKDRTMFTRGRELQKIRIWTTANFSGTEAMFFVEEPPLAGTRNIRTFMHLAQTAGVIGASVPRRVVYVPVSKWKIETVGHGNAKKSDVLRWLSEHYQGYSAQCERTDRDQQDYADAACIAIYGSKVLGLDI